MFSGETGLRALAAVLRGRQRMRGIGRRFVYILRSQTDPAQHYVGIASDVDERLDWHNGGPTGFTLEHRPWSVVVSIEFSTERDAVRFEKYLKTGSGRAFTKGPSRRECRHGALCSKLLGWEAQGPGSPEERLNPEPRIQPPGF